MTSVLGNSSANLVLSGTLPLVNLALTSLSYRSNQDSVQQDTLTISINDNGNAGTNTISLTPASGIRVVADPVLTGKQDLVIQGTSGNDVVTVAPGKVAGTYQAALNGPALSFTGVTGRILAFGLGGNDNISLSSTVKLPALLVVGNGNNTLLGGAGNDTILAGSGSNKIDGGLGVNTLVESGNVDFKLVGGTTKINGTLTKGTSTDTLVLNHIQQVQLSLIGPDSHKIDGSGFAGLETLMGGTGNDTLIAGIGNDVLVGGSGNDVLMGGTGKNLLIAGGGADNVVGGTNQDLIIGGSTTYDNNLTALAAIMAEWTSADTYAVRIKRSWAPRAGARMAASRSPRPRCRITATPAP